MPGIVMHHHIGHVIYSGFDEKFMDVINQDLYDLGLAGPDIYSRIEYFNKRKNSGYQDLSLAFHTQDTKKYFLALCDEVGKNRDLFGYLCGQVAHYYLDVFVNPYIYYTCGFYDPSIDNTLKFRGRKQQFEQQIDANYIQEVYDGNPRTFKIAKRCFNIEKLNPTLASNFDNLFLKAYHLRGGYKLVCDGIRYTKKFYNKTYDPLGIKNSFFVLKDDGKSKTVYKYLTFKKSTIDAHKYDYSNSHHELWINPIDNQITSKASLGDLFKSAESAIVKCFNELYKYFFEDVDVDLDYLFSDLSYMTGLPCEKGYIIKNVNIKL